MKISYIIAIVVIAVGIAVIISSSADASTYATFTEAQQLAQKGDDDLIHVVGTLKKDAAGEVVGIEKTNNNLAFSFIMVDEDGREQKVLYKEPMPNDFMRSEQVVITGNYKGTVFMADKILLKCPSKYKETEVEA